MFYSRRLIARPQDPNTFFSVLVTYTPEHPRTESLRQKVLGCLGRLRSLLLLEGLGFRDVQVLSCPCETCVDPVTHV